MKTSTLAGIFNIFELYVKRTREWCIQNLKKQPFKQKSKFFDTGSLQVFRHYMLHFLRGRGVKL